MSLLSNAKQYFGMAKEALRLFVKGGPRAVAVRYHQKKRNYAAWEAWYGRLDEVDRLQILRKVAALKYQPVISIIMPVYNIDDRYLRLALDSVLDQYYPHWELCIADDCSTQPHVRKTLEEYRLKSPRVKIIYREQNGHISEATNSAISLATGEFIAFLDHDDELTAHALYLVADELNHHPDADLIYSDQDTIDVDGKLCKPLFKPDWSPDLFYSVCYTGHLSVYRATVLRDLGGPQHTFARKGFEGSQDYDLTLRFIEKTSPEKIRHVPQVLYHWRAHPESVAQDPSAKSYAHENARKALREHLERRGIKAEVVQGYAKYHRVVYPIPTPEPKVSLIIPTRDKAHLLKGICEGVLKKTDYSNIELLIVDNNSSEKETLDYLEELKRDARVKVIRDEGPFNYSAINNHAARQATGQVLGLLNNDLLVIKGDWLKEMVSHALRPEIGCVGPRLLYADGRIQHAGVITGLGRSAGHSHKAMELRQEGHMARPHITGNYSAVTAACLLIRKSLYDEVGGLDELYAVAFNDVDFCLRVQKKGYRNLYTPYAELYHLESASRGYDFRPEHLPRFNREMNLLNARWGDSLYNDPYYNPNLTLEREDFSFAFPPRFQKPWK